MTFGLNISQSQIEDHYLVSFAIPLGQEKTYKIMESNRPIRRQVQEFLFRESEWFNWIYNDDSDKWDFEIAYDFHHGRMLVRVFGRIHDPKKVTYLKMQKCPT